MIDQPHLFEFIYSAIIPIAHNITLLDETLPIFWLICFDLIKQDKSNPNADTPSKKFITKFSPSGGRGTSPDSPFFASLY
jgi:hypothetical protein